MNKINKKKIIIIIIFDILILPIISLILYLRKGEFGISEKISISIMAIIVLLISIYMINRIKKKINI